MLKIHSFSEVGGHLTNEDVFVVEQHPFDPTVWLCFLADGQGGQSGGGRAAEVACQTALSTAKAIQPERLKDPKTWTELGRIVDEAIRADSVAGFTTFIGFCIVADRIVGVSHGDSAVLLVRGEETVKLTFSQHKNPPVGSGAVVPAPFLATVKLPWRLVAMTDGVWKYVGWKRLVDTAKMHYGNELISELQKAARLPGSGQFQDDFTLVLIEADLQS